MSKRYQFKRCTKYRFSKTSQLYKRDLDINIKEAYPESVPLK